VIEDNGVLVLVTDVAFRSGAQLPCLGTVLNVVTVNVLLLVKDQLRVIYFLSKNHLVVKASAEATNANVLLCFIYGFVLYYCFAFLAVNQVLAKLKRLCLFLNSFVYFFNLSPQDYRRLNN
jgi:hypothetical protein